MSPPILLILSGLPGAGKSTLAQQVARETGAVYLRIDTLEQGLRDLCGPVVADEGYRLAYRIAADNLRVGSSVIADSCNPLEITRRAWRQVARGEGARHLEVEVVCSDAAEHRRRVETRASDVPGLVLPTWEAVRCRDYEAWSTERLVIDTAHEPPPVAAARIVARVVELRALEG